MEFLTDRELEDRFDDFLNEVHEVVTICGYHYDPARALKEIDNIAYREEFNNWLDSELKDGRLFELPNGDYTDEKPEEE